MSNKIGVLGHWPIDIDSYVSAHMMVQVLKFQWKDAVVVLQDKLDDQFIAQLAKYNIPMVEYKLLDDVVDMDIILVDNNVPPERMSGHVIQTIDHHTLEVGYVKNDSDIICPASSAALVVYDSFKDVFYFTNEDRRIIYIATALDTCAFLSSKFMNEDSINELVKAEIDFTDLEENDYLRTIKHHCIDGVSFDSAYISKAEYFDISEYFCLFEKEVNYLFLFNFIKERKTIAIFKFNGELHRINYDHLASRATEIIPEVCHIIKRALK